MSDRIDKGRITNNFTQTVNVTSGYVCPSNGLIFVDLDSRAQAWAYSEIRVNNFLVRFKQSQDTVNFYSKESFTLRVFKGDTISWSNANSGQTVVSFIATE